MESTRTQKALDYCNGIIERYSKDAVSHRNSYFISQAATVFLAGITPLLIIAEQVPKIIQAIPPTIASMTAGMVVYKWHKNWVCCKDTAEALESERVKFELRVTTLYDFNLNEDAAIGNFLDRIYEINSKHIQDWKVEAVEGLKETATPQKNLTLQKITKPIEL